MNLDIDIANDEHKSIVNVAGEIDVYTAGQLKEAILPLTKKQGSEIEVNLANVNYMDSTGLGIFVSALKSTKEHDSHLKLVQLQDRVLRLFKITGLNEIIDIEAAVQGGGK